MINKLKLWLARRQLAALVKHEEELRASLAAIHKLYLPRAEKRVERAELTVFLDTNLRSYK